VSERLARYFGVWREADAGFSIVFDPLFEKGVPLPAPGEPALTISRSYHPAHDIGHFRFLECSHRSEKGAPTGEVTFWDEIRFPFDPALEKIPALNSLPVKRSNQVTTQQVQEVYECDSGGSITVTIGNQSAGYCRKYQLGHWSRKEQTVKPLTRRRK